MKKLLFEKGDPIEWRDNYAARHGFPCWKRGRVLADCEVGDRTVLICRTTVGQAEDAYHLVAEVRKVER